jgi:hypothetical protein
LATSSVPAATPKFTRSIGGCGKFTSEGYSALNVLSASLTRAPGATLTRKEPLRAMISDTTHVASGLPE